MKKYLPFLDFLLLSTFFLYPVLFIGIDLKVFNATRFVWSIILPVFAVWLVFNYRRYDVKLSLKFLGPFFPIIIASAILSFYHHRSVDMDILPKLIILGVAFGALVAVYKKRQFYIINSIFCWLALFWMGSIVIQEGIHAYINNFTYRINQNETYMMVVLMSGVSLLASQQVSGKERIFHLLSGLAGLVCVILTQSRGALLDIFVLFCFFLFSSKGDLKSKLLMLFSLLLVCTVVFCVTNGFGGKMMRIGNEVALWLDGKGQATSIGTRFSLWYAGLVDVFPHFPIMGTAVAEGHLGDLAQLVTLTKRPGWTIGMQPHFHNDFVQMAVKGGLVYLTAGIASLALLTAQYRKNVVVLWMIACAVVSGLTEHFYFQPRVFVFFVMILTLVVAGIYKERQESLSKS